MRQLPERIFLVVLLFLGLPLFGPTAVAGTQKGFEIQTAQVFNEKNALLIPEMEEEREGDGEEEEVDSHEPIPFFCPGPEVYSGSQVAFSGKPAIGLSSFVKKGRRILQFICVLMI